MATNFSATSPTRLRGSTFTLAGLKAFLEHGIQLQLVAVPSPLSSRRPLRQVTYRLPSDWGSGERFRWLEREARAFWGGRLGERRRRTRRIPHSDNAGLQLLDRNCFKWSAMFRRVS